MTDDKQPLWSGSGKPKQIMTDDDSKTLSGALLNSDTCVLDCGCRLTVGRSKASNTPVTMVNRCQIHEEGELYDRSSTIRIDGGDDDR